MSLEPARIDEEEAKTTLEIREYSLLQKVKLKILSKVYLRCKCALFLNMTKNEKDLKVILRY